MTGPIHNSAVFILGQEHHAPVVPPLSPPSPVTPSNGPGLCVPIEELSLDKDIIVAGPASPSLPETPSTPRTSEFDGQSCSSELFDDRLASAIHVLNTEATSLASLTHLYSCDPVARVAFNSAVDIITSRQRGMSRGKLVIIGVGKSGHIARKLVATFNSLSIHASFLHPTEALHGDLGHVGADDTLMLITFSGKTPELSLLMPHLDPSLPLVVLTGKTLDAPVVLEREKQASAPTILLPAPIHESETVSFGVSAPTTSTTMALAVGDALALTCARELNPVAGGVAAVFGTNHPGGAIGATYQKPQTVRDVMVPYEDITCLSGSQVLVGGDVLKAAYVCKTGWLRVGEDAVVSPCRIRRMGSAELATGVSQMPWLTVPRASFVSLGAATQLKDAGEWLRANMEKPRDLLEDEDVCTPESIVAVLDDGDIIGVMEASAVLDAAL
ncbi:SIS domain-containing protein [Diaporthe helianthi]|uniref:SIS domain-containing protein n=1 Tax=Diaporthe helianthi TaxID=158607 RepID=A0A2P5HNT3_DIAHE|nr:SIS domain-containing protein [Diaporthe helianthi]